MDNIPPLIHLYAQFRILDKTFTEYEAFLYENMCVALNEKMKLDTLAIKQALKQTQEEINGTNETTKTDTFSAP